jgi:hypothetical protein
MAIAHICQECGFDLARVRPVREPHYNLPLVRCPRCAWCSVRRRHPLWVQFQRFRRLDFAVTVLGIQTLLFLGFGALTMLAVISLLAAMYRITSNTAGDDIGWFVILPLGVLAPALGAWLTAGFSHVRRRTVWMVWTAYIALLLMGFVLLIPMVGEFPPGLGPAPDYVSAFEANPRSGHSAIAHPDPWRSFASLFFLAVGVIFIPGMIVLGLIMLATMTGVPIGRGLLWLFAAWRTQSWRWRRKRRRIARIAG